MPGTLHAQSEMSATPAAAAPAAPPVRLHASAAGALTAAARAFGRALRAWREVSARGAARAVRVADALLTLGEASSPAPGALAAAADDGAEALAWLRASAARLARALAGLALHRAALQAEAAGGDGGEALLATLGLEGWVAVYEAGVVSLEGDLEEKQGFLGLVDGVLEGREALDRRRLQFGVDAWLEMPAVREEVVDLVEAAFDAEVEACALLEAERAAAARMSPARTPGRRMGGIASPFGTPEAAKSPALSMLLGSGGKGSSQKKKKGRG